MISVDHRIGGRTRKPMSDRNGVIVTARANLWRGPESVGGQLTLTHDRLSFRAHSLNVQKASLDLPVREIVSVRRYRSMGIIPNGLAVAMISGDEYRFVVGRRGEFVAGIEAHRS
jgi:hypothetical protein